MKLINVLVAKLKQMDKVVEMMSKNEKKFRLNSDFFLVIFGKWYTVTSYEGFGTKTSM